MKNKWLLVLFLGSLSLIITSGVSDTNSNAAPLGSTGAPGENTCAKNTCHTGSAVNGGSAFLDINYGNNLTTYEPDEIYNITVSLQQTGIQRFGFQLLALNNNNENTGTFLVTDSLRTQTQVGTGAYTGRDYITYKFPGTEPFSAGRGEWSFQWKAPAVYQGAITFYAASVAANNDATDDGDTVYTKHLTIQQAVTGIETISGNQLSVNVFPNPSHGTLNILYQTTQTSNTIIKLTDLLSRNTYSSVSHADDAGEHHSVMDISQMSAGIYLLTVTSNHKTNVQKVIID